MGEGLSPDEASQGSFDRRRFIRRAAITGAVAVPIVSSFSMTGVNSAFAQQTNVSGKTTTTEGGTSPTSGSAPTTTSTTEVPNQTPSTSTTTTAPNQPPSTTTTTTLSNQPPR